MAKKDNDFDFVNLPVECKDPEISKDDFVLTDVDKAIHEQKFQTKPTTFVKDSLKRFKKNKSSVVAAYILGILILCSIIVPLCIKQDLTVAQDTALNYLQPKLFDNANGFWDGTTYETNVPLDTTKDPMMPNPDDYLKDGIDMSTMVITNEQYTERASSYGKMGYAEFGYTRGSAVGQVAYINSYSPKDVKMKAHKFTLDLDTTQMYLSNFVSLNEEQIRERETGGPQKLDSYLPENTVLGNITLDFVYTEAAVEHRIPLTETSITHNISDANKVDINALILAESGTKTTFDDFYFSFRVEGIGTPSDEVAVAAFVESMGITVNSDAPKLVKEYFDGGIDEDLLEFKGICFTDATEMLSRTLSIISGVYQPGYWSADNLKYVKKVYLSRCTYGSFKYDGYKGQLGTRRVSAPESTVTKYRTNKWVWFNIDLIKDKTTGKWIVKPDTYEFEILNAEKCPIIKAPEISDITVNNDTSWSVNCDVTYYKYIGYDTMPKFIFGTDKAGRDMFKYVFDGLKWSLLLGLFTFIICFTFGLIWGAICGYFGGTVDLVMERLTDILSGLPWIVLMTIVILKTGRSDFWTFALALCLTGWIGTASTTRTQFYRFRGREYVLASRTLGASDARLIAKHVLPNALGTIITSSVLIIPSVIFSEATISYLGLGFKNLSSLGVILSSNQAELTSHPYALIFPSVIIALVMISFNLFGNGLRDAINPSLKGEDE